MLEVFKDIKGFESLYQITNLGRVKSKERITGIGYGAVRIEPEKWLRITEDSNGYLSVVLWKDNKPTRKLIHRLVMEAFLPNPDSLPQVNHKDENKANNMVWVNEDGTVDLEKSNLEWCTRSYNVNYGTAIDRMRNKMGKKIIQIDPVDNYVIAVWDSIRDCSRFTKINKASISGCLNNKRYKTAGGFKWEYA
jgi:hypothetical protein